MSVAHTLSQALGRDLVVATARTRASAGGFVSMQALAAPLLSEYPKDQRLFEVTEIRRGRSRWQLRAETQLSPFIGREMQLQILNKAWHDASDGEGQTVFVVGDPGLGKSRVTHEFVGAIPHDDAENLEVGALETDLRSGFVVIRKVLQALFGVGDTEAPAIAIEKVLAARSAQGFDERLLDPIMAIMELPVQDPSWAIISGQERSRRMQEAAVGLLLFLGRMKPVVLLVEDLHWIDAESEAVLVRLAQAVPTVRFLLILTCRPEYDRSAFAGCGTLPKSACRRSIRPKQQHFLTTWLAATLSSSGSAARSRMPARAMHCSWKRPSAPSPRPASWKGSRAATGLRARSARSPFRRTSRRSSMPASNVSTRMRSGWPRSPRSSAERSRSLLLRRMAALSSLRFDAALQNLKKADLLVERPGFSRGLHPLQACPHPNRRVGTHRLVGARRASQDCACRTRRPTTRTGWRSTASAWPDTPSRLTFGTKPSVIFLISARKAIRRSAHASALEQLDLGVWLLRSNDVADADEREIEFQLARGVALMAARGWGSTEVLAAFERAEELCEKIGDQARLFTALRGRAQYYMLSGKPAAAQELAYRWAGMVKDDSDPGLAIETEHMFWTNNFFLGETAAAHDHAERAIGLYDPDRDHYLTYKYSGHDPGVCCRCFAGLSAWLAGEPDRARLRCDDAIGLADRLQHPLSHGSCVLGDELSAHVRRRARGRASGGGKRTADRGEVPAAAHQSARPNSRSDGGGSGWANGMQAFAAWRKPYRPFAEPARKWDYPISLAFTPKHCPTAADWTTRRSRLKLPSSLAATTEPISSSPNFSGSRPASAKGAVADRTRSSRCSRRPRMSRRCSVPRSASCASRWISPAVFESAENRRSARTYRASRRACWQARRQPGRARGA